MSEGVYFAAGLEERFASLSKKGMIRLPLKKRALTPLKPIKTKGRPASEIIIEERGRTLKEHIAEHMKDPEFRKAWQNLNPEFGLMEEMLKTGEKKNK